MSAKCKVRSKMEPSKQFVVRHEAKHSAVKNGTRDKRQFRAPIRFVAN
ncbi:MAG: hypothetical protein RMK18_12765 [Armatimonadota bacterium]|nr:hypothetical protein [Armatimonadota bacterium]MDW8026714.1 hypothetical protein [Armatimonadota bacterium]